MVEPAVRTDRPKPVAATERIPALDVLRGIAILGILVMNIQGFALPFAAYSNPSVWTPGDTLDRFFWGLAHVLAEQKFMTLFSLLFGSGVALMLDRLEHKGLPVAAVHYRRTLGLLLIGLAHAYLLWYGDILVSYAICALALYPLRHVRPSRLLAAGLVLLLVAPLLSQGFMVWTQSLPAEVQQEILAGFSPGDDEVAAEVAAYREGWSEAMPYRASYAAMLQTFGFLFFVLWRAGGLMLVGMAFYRWGIVTAERSAAFYRRLALWGFLLGFPLVLAGVAYNVARDFDFPAVWFTNGVLNYLGSLGVSLGYLALVMLWCGPRGTADRESPEPAATELPDTELATAPEPTPEATPEAVVPEPAAAPVPPPAPPTGIQRTLAAVGRMALTNYLMQTLICIAIFYGFGLGLFGAVGRGGQWIVVLAVWAFQLLISPWWLTHFRFGPFEWLWRSMTYLRWQPMRR